MTDNKSKTIDDLENFLCGSGDKDSETQLKSAINDENSELGSVLLKIRTLNEGTTPKHIETSTLSRRKVGIKTVSSLLLVPIGIIAMYWAIMKGRPDVKSIQAQMTYEFQLAKALDWSVNYSPMWIGSSNPMLNEVLVEGSIVNEFVNRGGSQSMILEIGNSNLVEAIQSNKQIRSESSDTANALLDEITLALLARDVQLARERIESLDQKQIGTVLLLNAEACVLIAEADIEKDEVSRQSKYDEAKKLLSQIDDYPRAVFNLALLHTRLGLKEQATKYWDQYIALEDDPDLAAVVQDYLAGQDF